MKILGSADILAIEFNVEVIQQHTHRAQFLLGLTQIPIFEIAQLGSIQFEL